MRLYTCVNRMFGVGLFARSGRAVGAEVGYEPDGKDERQGKHGGIELLRESPQRHDHGGKKHDKLNDDHPTVAAAQTNGKIDEEW